MINPNYLVIIVYLQLGHFLEKSQILDILLGDWGLGSEPPLQELG